MDPTPIITALIAAAASVLGVVITTSRTRKADSIKAAVAEQKQSDRLDSIEHKLDIHNGYAEKLGDISEALVAMQKDIEYLKK